MIGTRRRLLAAADVLAVLTAAALTDVTAGGRFSLVLLAMLPSWLGLAHAYGLYSADDHRAWHRTSDELPRLVTVATIFAALVCLAAAFASLSELRPEVAVVLWLVAVAVASVLRWAARALSRARTSPARVLLVGSEAAAEAIRRKLKLERGHHLVIVDSIEPQTCHHAPRALRAAIVANEVDRVIVGTERIADEELASIARVCRATATKLSVAGLVRTLTSVGTELHHVGEIPFLEVQTCGPSAVQLRIKRGIELVFGGFAALCSLPLVAVVALAIRLDSPGPVFFRQQRAGAGGKPFTMLKFRTMTVDAEARLSELVAIENLDKPMFKIAHDPRVTRVGAFLRATSLDELPQIFNVLRGHMSLVGPRPEELALVERYSDDERAVRLGMKPGITGPMQIHGRGELTFDERIAVERDYVDCFSLRKDAQILARTVGAVIFRGGAF